jgi:hypothetical protein
MDSPALGLNDSLFIPSISLVALVPRLAYLDKAIHPPNQDNADQQSQQNLL